jgi:hypothetical protein
MRGGENLVDADAGRAQKYKIGKSPAGIDTHSDHRVFFGDRIPIIEAGGTQYLLLSRLSFTWRIGRVSRRGYLR